MKTEFPCPVCGHDSFGEPPGSFGICSVCNWEDDPSQIRHPRMRGGANTGSIYDYQQESDSWRITKADVRDPDWRPMHSDEAELASGEIGSIDCTLDYYGDKEPYYWRNSKEATSHEWQRRSAFHLISSFTPSHHHFIVS